MWITDPLEATIKQGRTIHFPAAAIDEDNAVVVPITLSKLLEKGEKSAVTATT